MKSSVNFSQSDPQSDPRPKVTPVRGMARGTAEEQRAKRALNAENEGRTLRRWTRRTPAGTAPAPATPSTSGSAAVSVTQLEFSAAAPSVLQPTAPSLTPPQPSVPTVPPPIAPPPPAPPTAAPIAPPSSSLPGGFKVGDTLIYTGENHTYSYELQDGRSISSRVRHGMKCTVMGPAKVAMLGTAVSVRFDGFGHIDMGWGPVMETHSIVLEHLRHPRIEEIAEPRVIEPWPEAGYVEQRLHRHGFVDGAMQLTDSEFFMHCMSGRMRRWSI